MNAENLQGLLEYMFYTFMIIFVFHFIAFFIVWDVSIWDEFLQSRWFWVRMSILGGIVLKMMDG